MYSISIAMGAIQWRLLFKTEDAAQVAHRHLEQAMTGDPKIASVEDDFGQHYNGKPQGLLFEDMNQSKLANVELMLFNASAQMLAQKRAQTDPAFRAVSAAGPAIISPMPQPNGRGGF